MRLLQLLFTLSFFSACVHAQVTVYGPQGVLGTAQLGKPTYSTTATPFPTAVNNAFPSNYTGPAAFNPVVLAPPALPNPLPPSTFNIQLAAAEENLFSIPGQTNGLSIEHSNFIGFSIEMSVVDQVIGINGSFLFPPFLNLMALMVERSAAISVRVGGNTQEQAVVVDSLPNNKAVAKNKTDTTNPTDTPDLEITPEFIYILSNVSSLLNINWYLGIPFYDVTNLQLAIAEVAESILGDRLLGLQGGNEPDLYAAYALRPQSYMLRQTSLILLGTGIVMLRTRLLTTRAKLASLFRIWLRIHCCQ